MFRKFLNSIGVQENGNDSNKYKRIETYAAEEGIMLTDTNNNKLQQKMAKDEDDIVNVKNMRDDTRKYVVACAIFASLNSVLLGYGTVRLVYFLFYASVSNLIVIAVFTLTADVGVMSGAIIFIQQDLKITETQQEILVGILSIVSLLGSLAGGKTSDTLGRKWTIAFACIIFQSGAAIMALAPSYQILMIGRLLAGIGIGFGIMIAPVYIAEISPSIARGSLTSFPEIFINLGILLGYISNYVFSGLPVHSNWRIMLGVGIAPSVFLGFALFIIPESPRWLVMQNRIEEARIVLLKTYDNTKEVDERLAEIQIAARIANADKYKEEAVWLEILNPSPAIKRMLITGCGIQCFQQISGIDATVYYSPTIFKDAGIKGNTELLAATVAVGFTKTVFILAAIFLIDKLGRKPLLYISTIGMTISLFCLSFTLTFLGDQRFGIGLAILFVCSNVAFFSIGIGPICWVVSSEIFPLRLRAQASGLGAVGSRVSSGVICMSFLTLSRAITVGGTFLVFSVISALSIVFVHTCVPETKGKSLEQIQMLFQKGSGLQVGGEIEMGDAECLVQRQ